MTLEQLLATSLWRQARCVAGGRALWRDACACAPVQALEEGAYVMPGTLFLADGEEVDVTPELAAQLVSCEASGLVFLGDDAGLSNDALRAFDRMGIALVEMSGGTNLMTLMKRFGAALYRSSVEEAGREDWLRCVCDGLFEPGDVTAAKRHGYNPACAYNAIIFEMKGEKNPAAIARDAEVLAVRGIVEHELALEGAPALSYQDGLRIVAFVPRDTSLDNGLNLLRLHVRDVVNKARTLSSAHKWFAVVGSSADALEAFRASYLDALRVREITMRIGVRERVIFYYDWLMQRLLFSRPKQELMEYMQLFIAPILGAPELLETLRTYIVSGGNLKHIADRLYIHPNTLKYRINNIQELLGVDLKDPYTVFCLGTALTIELYFRSEG